MEKSYLQLYKKDPKKAIAMITNFSVTTFDTLTKDWLNYFTYLFVKYMDGNVKTPNPKNPFVPNVAFPGMGPVYEQLIVDQTGDHYRVLFPPPHLKLSLIKHSIIKISLPWHTTMTPTPLTN